MQESKEARHHPGTSDGPHVFVAGATGYLGMFITQELVARGVRVTALSRSEKGADRLRHVGATPVIAEATDAESLLGVMHGVDMAVSSLGITRQRDGLRYEDVDYGANLNLLAEAERAGVRRFGYVSVFGGPSLRKVAIVEAKERFVDALQERALAGAVEALVWRPTGFFSDMSEILSMASGGRAWVFGRGDQAINPIHGADLAKVAVDDLLQPFPLVTDDGLFAADVGGPEVLSMREIADLAFAALEQPARVSSVPLWLARLAEVTLPWVTPQSIYGPAQLFLAAARISMVAPTFGQHRLADHFRAEVGGNTTQSAGAAL